MGTEQLAMLIEGIQNLGGDAKTVLLVLLGVEALKALLVFGGVVGSIWLLIKLALRLHDPHQKFKEWRDRLGTGSGGELTSYEVKRTADRIDQILKESGVN